LENFLKKNEIPPDESLSEFSAVCKTLFDSLRTLVSAGENKIETASISDFPSSIQTLYRALEHGESVSQTLYGELKPVLAQRLRGDQLAQVDELISDFEFEQAANLLQIMLRDRHDNENKQQA